MKTIEIKNVTKRFKNREVLKDVTLTLKGGSIYGICGENGCGKTVLLKIICGLMGKQGGEILFDGEDIEKVHPSIGIVFNGDGFFMDLNAFENLKLLSEIRNTIDDNRIKESIRMVGLDPDNKQTVRQYSLGMKQRLTIAQALMENDEILLLDEPTNALDEKGVKVIHDLILKEKDKGKVIVLTSHNRYDIDTLCDVIYRIENGRVMQNEKV